ncbi:MAG: PAS domain S-box protein [Phycisphaerae bacterium]|jgi:PAS domain S-box-containing protein
MNKLLQRQIKKLFGDVDSAPKDFESLFKAISDAYDGSDADRSLIERALDISSEELTGINRKLRQEVSEHKDTQEKIRQTLSLLKATLESTADGILVVDLKGKIVSYNQKFQQMWHIPDEIIESKDDSELLAFVLNQLADPEGFLTEVRRLYTCIEKGSFDLLKFKDGRIFERFSQPQKIEDRIVGRVWSFHDITRRKQAEKRLMEVNSLQKLLLPSIPIEKKLKFVTDTMVRILDADFARIWVIKPGDRCNSGCIHAEIKEGPHVCLLRDKCLHLIASSGRYTHIDGKVHCRVPFGCYKIGLIAAGQEDKFLTNEAATDSHIHNRDWARELGLVSFAGYRLMHTDGTPLGVLALFSKHPISPEEDALLEGIAHSTSMVLHASHAEEALRHEKDFAESLTGTAQVIMLVLDTNARIVSFNPYMEEISGYKLEDVKGKDWFDTFLPKADHSRIREVFKQAISGIQTKGDANSIITKNGREVLIEWYDKTLKDKDGRIVGLIAIGQDITERKKAEEQLCKTEEKYRMQFEGSLDAIFVADAETGILIDCNPAATGLVGWEKSELIGKPHQILHPPEMIEGEFNNTFKQHLGEKQGQTIETRVITKNGEIKDVAIKANLLNVRGKKILQGIFRDITENKKTEQRQVQLLRQLEKTNQELISLVYTLSHDLKAPLRGISTLADWLSTDYADKLDDKGKEQMNLLVRRASRMHNLIDGISQYSKVGLAEKEKVVVNLNELVTEAIDAIAPPENITITVENELPTIECGHTRIMQVFQNLLSNAVKYMDKPKGQIKVGCVEKDGFWEFYVADNGPGIEEKYFEKIFQLFQTLAPRDEFESTGIGLTVAKKIVELYNGKIWVESEPGQGSTFFFTLPKQDIRAEKNEELQANIVG